jgi:plasmid stability protein
MPRLVIRDLDARILARLEEQARKNDRSLQDEVKAILEQAAETATREEALALLDKWQRRWGERVFSDSTPLIRDARDRDAR